MSEHRNVLVIGATSAMAHATARKFAAEGDSFVLVARNEIHLMANRDDLFARGGTIDDTIVADLGDCAAHEAVVARAFGAAKTFDLVIIAHGTLPTSEWQTPDETLRTVVVNGASVVSLASRIADCLVAQHHPALIVLITSVASDRGKQSNYTYCAAKALVSTYAAGLRHRLSIMKSPVRVVDVRPGPTDTPMTRGIEKKGPLWASSTDVADGLVRLVRAHERAPAGAYFPGVVYLPRFWWLIMLVIRSLPDRLFLRTQM